MLGAGPALVTGTIPTGQRKRGNTIHVSIRSRTTKAMGNRIAAARRGIEDSPADGCADERGENAGKAKNGGRQTPDHTGIDGPAPANSSPIGASCLPNDALVADPRGIS